LAVQSAEALGGEFQGPSFNREEGYDACNRLQGLGWLTRLKWLLVKYPSVTIVFVSRRGLMLRKLIGQGVPNADKYHI
jgi:hypothetical protein